MKNLKKKMTYDGKNAIIYTRVSTEEQKENGYSLTNQLNNIRRWAENHKVKILAEFQDEHSAKNFVKRKGIQKALKFINENKRLVDFLLIAHWDRFSRNETEAVSNIYELSLKGVVVKPIDSTDEINSISYKMERALKLVSRQSCSVG